MRRVVIMAVAVALAVLVVVMVFRATDTVTSETASLSVSRPFRIASGAGTYFWPDVSGDLVVWTDDRNSTKDASGFSNLDNLDVYGFDVERGRELTVCTAQGRQLFPRVSGHRVVWPDRRDNAATKPQGGLRICGLDLAKGRQFEIPGVRSCVSNVDISGDIVVWADSRNQSETGSDIYAYDLGERREFAVCTASGDQRQVAVSGDVVVWVDGRGEGAGQDASAEDGAIYAGDLSSGKETRLSSAATAGMRPQIEGDTVTWLMSQGKDEDLVYEVVVCDLKAGQARAIPDLAFTSFQYGLGDGVIVGVTGDPLLTDSDVTGYDLRAHAVFAIARDRVMVSFPATDGDRVVWEEADQSSPDFGSVLMGARLERK